MWDLVEPRNLAGERHKRLQRERALLNISFGQKGKLRSVLRFCAGSTARQKLL